MAPQTLIPMTDSTPMPWGRYRGKAMADVPAVYLLLLYDKGISDDRVRNYINANMEALRKEAGRK